MTVAWGIPTPEDASNAAADSEQDLQRAKQFLEQLNKEYGEWNNKYTLANWEYAANLTEENLAKKLNVSAEVARYFKSAWERVNEYPWKGIKDSRIRRQFKKFSVLGRSALPEDVTIELFYSVYDTLNFYSEIPAKRNFLPRRKTLFVMIVKFELRMEDKR